MSVMGFNFLSSLLFHFSDFLCCLIAGGGRGVMVIVVGNGHGDTSSNPGRD